MKNIILVIITLLIVGCGIEKDNKMDIIDFRDLTYDATNLLDDVNPIWDINLGYAEDDIVRYGNKLYRARKKIGANVDAITWLEDGVQRLKLIGDFGTLASGYPYSEIFWADEDYGISYTTPNEYKFLVIKPDKYVSRYSYDASTTDISGTVIPDSDNKVYFNIDDGYGYSCIGNGNFKMSKDGFAPNPTPHSYKLSDSSTIIHTINWSAWTRQVKDDYDYNRYDILDVLHWQDIGYTNKYKALDTSLSSQTTNNGIITMEFTQAKVDSIFFLNIYAQSIRVQVLDINNGNLSVYDTLKDNWDLNATDWYDYFFNEPTTYNKINFDVPIVFNAKILITINPIVDGTTLAKVGLVGMGRRQEIGGVLYGSSTKIIDYSTKQVNGSGETYLEVGDYKVSNNIQIDIDTGTFDFVNDLLASLRAKPVMFNGSDEFKTFQVFGVFKDYTTLLSGVSKSRLNLQIESMI